MKFKIEIKPRAIKDGKKEFVVHPFEEFLKIQEQLQDLEDLKALREARSDERDIKGLTLAEAKNDWKL